MTRIRRFLVSASVILFLLASGSSGAAQEIWTVLAFDPKGDVRDLSLADAALLSYRYDSRQDLLWFRVTLYGKTIENSFGVNIVIDTGADAAAATNMNWWGANTDFKFDKIVTAWVTRGVDGAYAGTIGVGDVAGARARNLNNLIQNNLQIRVQGDSILVGVKRTDLTDKMKMNLIAAVGSNQQWNDDIPNLRYVTVDLTAPRPARGIRELDTNRNNFSFPGDYKPLADNQPPSITKKGHGPRTLILIPGVYSGKEVFDGFIARNQSGYTFYVLTPPGLNGTPARALPPETTTYGDFTWTRRLERDILELIGREKLHKPVIVVHGFPGSLAAHELASRRPETLGGVIDIASMPVQFFPSLKDPSGKTPATPGERIEYVNEGWAEKWFKYVTPDTWESNNYRAEMFTNDLDRAEQVRRQVEAPPLPVKIRYLCEFMASDDTSKLNQLNVPLLALRPGFNDKYFADPANSFYKMSFKDAWDAFSENSRIQMLTIPDARALILDDQPKEADDAIARFLHGISNRERSER